MSDINGRIAERLRALRRERGWSLDAAARETGVSKAMLGQIERGESSPTVATLWKIAAGFHTSFSGLLEILASEPRVRVVEQQERYLRAEFTSLVFRFVDDVEFLIGERQIDVRSASRIGHSDFGVNRKRIEHLRRRLSP